MNQVDWSFAKSAALCAEMQTALVGTAMQFGDAVRRFERRRQRCGLDHFCSRLLDEVSLSRSMLLLLAEEIGEQAGSLHALRTRPVADRREDKARRGIDS